MVLTQHQFGEVSIADILGGALREEIDVVVVVFELVLFLQFGVGGFGLGSGDLFYAQFLVETHPPLVGVDVLVVVLDPGEGLFVSCVHLRFFTFLH
jgi:hypothetical protein